jgi:hypothetical protein
VPKERNKHTNKGIGRKEDRKEKINNEERK